MTLIICLVLLFVLYVGFELGRWFAETGRASHDMKRTWEHRKRYREDD